jgi:TRAP-type C4-dicarboxylate transport system permease small subunit
MMRVQEFIMVLHRISNYANQLTHWTVIVLTIVMTISVLVQITARNIFNCSFVYLEELSRYLLVWVTFLGAAIAYKAECHLGVLFFLKMLPAKLRMVTVFIANMLSLSFFWGLLYYGLMIASLTMHQQSIQMRIPMGIIYSVIPISGGLMVLHALCKLGESLANSCGIKDA